MDGTTRNPRYGRARGLGVALAPIAIGLASLIGPAAAAAAVGDHYILDIKRSQGELGAIYKVNPSTGAQTKLMLTADGSIPAAEQSGGQALLKEAVGLDVDEATGMLIVVTSEGYPGNYYFPQSNPTFPYSCQDGGALGCGAVLRVNPTNPNSATTSVISAHGPLMTPNYNQFIANGYSVLVIPSGTFAGQILVGDPGSGRVIRVNPSLPTNANQFEYFGRNPANDGESFLRVPWGLAQDPTTGDILVANAGNSFANGTEEEIDDYSTDPASCAGALDPQQNHGYILRYSATGTLLRTYCSADFRRPRDVAVDATGTILVTDPIASISEAAVDSGDFHSGYGVISTIDPVTGAVTRVSAGGFYASPSRMDFGPGTTDPRVLIADETGFPASPCGFCGGLVSLNPLGSVQRIVSSAGQFSDPIDVAVNRGGAGPPTIRFEAVPPFLEDLDRPEGKAAFGDNGVENVPLTPFLAGSNVDAACLNAKCRVGRKGKKIKVQITPSTKFRAFMKAKKPPPPPPPKCIKKCPVKSLDKDAYIAGAMRVIVSKPGLIGRYEERRVNNATDQLELIHSGCLRPGARSLFTTKRKKGKKGKKGKKKRVTNIIPCPLG